MNLLGILLSTVGHRLYRVADYVVVRQGCAGTGKSCVAQQQKIYFEALQLEMVYFCWNIFENVFYICSVNSQICSSFQ
jgi:hypothetical protein